MIKRIINNQFKTITAAAVFLGIASLASRFLGLIRDRLLAGTFGAGDELDIYYAAFRIPDLVYYLLVLGAISAGFIPVFVDYFKKNKEQSWYLVSSLVNLIAVFLIGVCLILIVFAPWLMKMVAPGFSAEKLATTTHLARIMFLSPLLLGISTIFGGVLQSWRRFFVYALAPIVYNLGIIFSILFLIDRLGLIGLSYGVVLGAFLHLVIQFIAVVQGGYRWRFVFDWRFKGVKRILKLTPPRFLSLTLNQVNILAMTIIASTLAAGSIAVYNLAHNIWSFPLGIFGISFMTASFPGLAEKAQKKDLAGFVDIFSSTVRQVLFFILPASALFIVLRAQIVRLILGTGRFDWQDTILTLDTLAYFCLGLFAEALALLFLRGFFAWEDAKTPFVLGFFAMLIRLFGAWFFASYLALGVPGLALGFSVGSVFYLILLFIALSNKLRRISKRDLPELKDSEKRIFTADMKFLIATFFSAISAYLALYGIDCLVDTHTGLGLLIQGGLAGLIGVFVYGFVCWLLRVPELNTFLSIAWSKLSGKKVVAEISEVE